MKLIMKEKLKGKLSTTIVIGEEKTLIGMKEDQGMMTIEEIGTDRMEGIDMMTGGIGTMTEGIGMTTGEINRMDEIDMMIGETDTGIETIEIEMMMAINLHI